MGPRSSTPRHSSRARAPPPATTTVRAAGWRDDTTLLGGAPATDNVAGSTIVTRGLDDPPWSTVAAVGRGCRPGPRPRPSRWSRPRTVRVCSCCYPAEPGPGPAACSSTPGQEHRVAVRPAPTATTTITPGTTATRCGKAGQPLTAHGGLRHPVDGRGHHEVLRPQRARLRHAGRQRADRAHRLRAPAGAWQERTWQAWTAALPFGGALALVGAVWMVLALRRSRRHGERLPPDDPPPALLTQAPASAASGSGRFESGQRAVGFGAVGSGRHTGGSCLPHP